jgi:hypothetical protein
MDEDERRYGKRRPAAFGRTDTKMMMERLLTTHPWEMREERTLARIKPCY